MTPNRKLTPVESYVARRRAITTLWTVIVLLAIVAFIYWRYVAQRPVSYSDNAEHFKYGSIGSDVDNGLPYWIWRVLPEMFPEYLPDPDAFLAIPKAERTALDGYRQFGFLVEPGRDLPIGFSKRRVNIDRVGQNCSICHVSTVRVSDGMDAEQIYGESPTYVSDSEDRILILGMPANTMDLQAYFEFLFNVATDADFTTTNVMAHINDATWLDPIEQWLYRQSVPLVRETLLARRQQLAYLNEIPRFGPGRVDTFNPYKVIFHDMPYDGTIGTVDLPSIWNQRPRVGMQLHWDGNNTSVFERNISAAFGAGVTAESLDLPRLLRVASWIGAPDPRQEMDDAAFAEITAQARQYPVPEADEMQIPQYPFAIDAELAAQGAAIYQAQCAMCHAWNGEQTGSVVPIDEIGTDPHRWESFTPETAAAQNTLGKGYWWQLQHFTKTEGYANMPLDGLWARAPYLHNGSVPTLADLLNEPASRPTTFYRGDDEYDPIHVGFRTDRSISADERALFLFDTTLPGNGNGGHTYGTDLSDEEKAALLEYMKSL